MPTSRLRLLCSASALLVIVSLSGCSGSGSSDTAPPAPAAPSGVDRTAELKSANASAAWIDQVTLAEETEPGRLEIATTIVDPRGEEGSAEAQLAIGVCEAGVTILGAGATVVSVLEQDGTSFVLFGHPSAPAGRCTEF
jgi:hypothetical protein